MRKYANPSGRIATPNHGVTNNIVPREMTTFNVENKKKSRKSTSSRSMEYKSFEKREMMRPSGVVSKKL
jgi:hypothetical protein